MDNEVILHLRELHNALQESDRIWTEYISAVSTAKKKSEELSILLNKKIKQPHITILDCEIDG